MLKLNVKINIQSKNTGKTYVFNRCTNCEIVSSWQTIIDTCIFTIPNRFLLQDGNRLVVGQNTIFSRMDLIDVSAGYNNKYEHLFSGYIASISIGKDLTFTCEDKGILLKNKPVLSKFFESATLKDVVSYALMGLDIKVNYDYSEQGNIADINIGTVKIENTSMLNAMQVLDFLNQKHHFISFFRNGELFIGNMMNKNAKQFTFGFQTNIIQDTDSLKYRKLEEIQSYIKGVSLLKGRKADETDETDPTGSKRASRFEAYCYFDPSTGKPVVTQIEPTGFGMQKTLHVYDNSYEQLSEYLKKAIYLYVYEGYYGDFETFLLPRVNHGDVINLKDKIFKERNKEGYNSFFVDKVIYKISVNGGFQQISLGRASKKNN